MNLHHHEPTLNAPGRPPGDDPEPAPCTGPRKGSGWYRVGRQETAETDTPNCTTLHPEPEHERERRHHPR